MSHEPPLVTVAVAVYNAGPYLRGSIDSMLAQTHERLEVIVVDDGSTDGSIDTITSIPDPRLVIVRQANAGKSVAMNRILDRARGDYFVIHDGDDLSHPERVARLVAHLEAHPELGACYSQHELIVGERRIAARSRALNPDECARAVAVMQPVAHDPTGMFRLSMVRGLRFDPELLVGQGMDYMLQVGEKYPVAVLGDCLYAYRVHTRSQTRGTPGDQARARQERNNRYLRLVRAKAHERRGLPPPVDYAPAYSPIPVGHLVECAIDRRLEGRRVAALGVAVDGIRAFGVNTLTLKPLAFALAPTSRLRARRRPSGPSTVAVPPPTA